MKKFAFILVMLAFLGYHQASGQWGTNGNNIYNTNAGNVGIGTNTPNWLLHVAKNMTEPNIVVQNQGGTGGATFTMLDNASGANWKFKATLSGGFKIRDHANSLDVIVIEPNSSANAIYINAAGNIGMGTAVPLANLHLSVGGYNAYAGLLITSTREGGKSLSINQGTAGKLNFTEPGVVDLMTMDFNQNNVGIGTVSPTSSAALEISSTTKGFLPPRMTMDQILAISGPADGLIVYCTTNSKFYAYIGSVSLWKDVLFGSEIIDPTCISFTLTHYTGTGCAPVSKTVTYAVASNIPGEIGKCWLAQNLGADHQATTVDDATEASAGWYWQFNRKQGYKHDGVTLTPAWTITGFSENSDWIAANDPCTFEFGGSWRLPTSSEWTNVIASGGWSNWNGPWNSALKMHAAGALDYSNGSLLFRGSYGYYWSNTQYDSSNGWYQFFYNSNCGTTYISKAHGFSARCLRD